MSPQNIEAYMKQLPNLQRYQNSFEHIWKMANDNGTPLTKNPSLLEIATLIVRLSLINKNMQGTVTAHFCLCLGWTS